MTLAVIKYGLHMPKARDTPCDKLVGNSRMRQVGLKSVSCITSNDFCHVKLDGVEEEFCCVSPNVATKCFDQLRKRQVASSSHVASCVIDLSLSHVCVRWL